MSTEFPPRAAWDYRNLPHELRVLVREQLNLLRDNLRHPSLNARKYGGSGDIWQGRVNRDYRLYFEIAEGTYRIITILPHPKQGLL
jgi:mRNA-degrading endonuclease RelE of RelBE toxin-antitoxin system